MDDKAPVYDWQGLFARSQRWGRDYAEQQRSKGHEIAPDPLPRTVAPATEAQIAREEQRLGVRLPPSLRSFYLESNGHGVVGNFIWAVRSVEQIGWLRDVVPYLYEIVVEDDPEVARSLVVSGESDASWWLLDPGEVDDRGEWRAGRWSSWDPGISWHADDFFGLFENEVSSAERLLEREKNPPPPPGTGRTWNEHTVGHIDSNTVDPERTRMRSGYKYVRAEGFASIVIISAPATARVGQWVPLKATRRSGPWNLVRQEDVRPEEIALFEPVTAEAEVAGNLSWTVDPPGSCAFNTDSVAGLDSGARAVKFDAPGVYKLKGYSAFPLPVYSNEVTIEVK